MTDFIKAKPGETGISTANILKFAGDITDAGIPLHSFAILHKGKLVAEHYYAPFNAGSLHRMFSISKSVTSIAIGLLIDEGRISLDDKITDYFPDYLPENVHPYLAALTIRNCLMMRTCYNKTTYTINKTFNWAESFFKGTPVLAPGTMFHYDTSSAQTLCALVERLTGMSLLDYVKSKLTCLDLSKHSYMLKDPSGTSIGGSGLMATTKDLLNIGYFLLKEGNLNGVQYLSSDYIRLATSKLSDTRFTAGIPAEALGYGMQFWRYYADGYMCYGMGGQFIIVIPQKELVLVTTADTQGIGGGNQVIHDSVMKNIINAISDDATEDSRTVSDNLTRLDCLELTPVSEGIRNNPFMAMVNGNSYRMDDNPSGFDNFSFRFANGSGEITYTLNGETLTHSFGFGYLIEDSFPKYNMWCTASAAWVCENILYVKFNILGDYLGTVHMEFSFSGNDVTIELKKVEESIFTEYNCILHGTLQ